MGWWSVDIIGGDTPLDLIWTFEDYFALDRGALYPLEAWSEKTRNVVRKSIERDHNGFWKTVDKAKEGTGFEGEEIAVQVAAVIWLNSGAGMSDVAKNIFITAARNDKWANEDDGDDRRKAVMDHLIKHIRIYVGTPVVIESEGLFDVISKKLDERVNNNTLSWPTPKAAVKDIINGLEKKDKKKLLKELLEEL